MCTDTIQGADNDDCQDAPLDAGLICSTCEYNLFGIPQDGRCPECGTPIAATLEAVSGIGLARRTLSRWSIVFGALAMLAMVLNLFVYSATSGVIVLLFFAGLIYGAVLAVTSISMVCYIVTLAHTGMLRLVG